MQDGDTIVAIATPRGEGGIGVVRLSGPGALRIGREIFVRRYGALPPAPRARAVYYGTAVDRSRELIDECLLTWFPAPHSYTAEEVVELSAHGSDLALARIVETACGLGARIAEPGEFTQRAFLNGRLDLARAEAVIDVIRARTAASLRLATRQLAGRLSREIGAARSALVSLLAEIEATIDFPDDVEPPAPGDLLARLRAEEARLRTLLATAEAGRLYREGASVVIAGRPNVGKSSLLNALLGEERAIVTPVPGTTRDVIEESINLGGIPVRAVDTAGLRQTDDLVERIGVTRTRRELEGADLTLLVIDATAGVTPEDRALAGELLGRVLLVANKIDLDDRVDAAALPWPAVKVSALTGRGLDDLRATIREELLGGEVAEETLLVSNSRHKVRIAAAASALRDAIAGAESGFELAAIAVDLKISAESLGEITGETVTEATISEIFARFCVGK